MVTPSYYPITGGAETLIRNLSIKLNQKGIHTDIMTFNMTKKWNPHWQARIDEIDGITVYRVPGLNWYPLTHSDRTTQGINLIPGPFRNHLKGYDIIHFHVGDLTFPFFSLTTKKPKITHFHGPLDFYQKSFTSRQILKNMADIYVAISRDMQQDLKELGVPEDKIRYIPNGVDSEIFHPTGTKEKNLILFVGRVTFDKGLHVLLDALPYVRTKTEMVIIGPPEYDVDYFQRIQNQIAKENKRGIHKITYLGEQEQNVVVKWCQKASIFVLPSFREACGIAILEALSCETAVVASNIEGIREVVIDGENGLLVPTNSPIKLASSIQSLLDNESLRTKFGIEGRKFVRANFSYDSSIQKFRRIYQDLLR